MTGRTVMGSTVLAAAVVAVSVVTSSSVASRAYVKRGEAEHRGRQTLAVTGSAKERIRSDVATWTIRVGGEGPTMPEAYARLEAAMSGVDAFLKERGFEAGAVAHGAIGMTTHYRRHERTHQETREVVSQELWRRVEIRTGDVDRVERAAGEVTELLKAGLLVRSEAPDFHYTKLADLKVKMIGAATGNARLRAETIATGSKCALGGVTDASAGVLQITPPWSTDVSSGGMNDTTTIEKDVTAVVHLTFAIEGR